MANYARNYKVTYNSKGMQMDEGSTLAPLFTVSNKIKLKNLQLKIGNSIRDAEKVMKKNMQGSIAPLEASVQQLQQQLSLLYTKNRKLNIQNKLLSAINSNRESADSHINSQVQQIQIQIDQLYKEVIDSRKDQVFQEDGFLRSFHLALDLGKKTSLASNLKCKGKKFDQKLISDTNSHTTTHTNLSETSLEQLMQVMGEQMKIVQQLKKQREQKQKCLQSLQNTNQKLTSQLKQLHLAVDGMVLESVWTEIGKKQNINVQERLRVQLQQLEKQEERVQQLIKKQNIQLSEQYSLNRESKQKIADRKYQQAKQVKVLEQEVAKCKQQLRDIKAKCRNRDLTTSSAYKI